MTYMAKSRPNEPRFEVTPIGTVESPLTDPASAPKQGDEGAPDAWLVFEPAVLDALEALPLDSRPDADSLLPSPHALLRVAGRGWGWGALWASPVLLPWNFDQAN